MEWRPKVFDGSPDGDAHAPELYTQKFLRWLLTTPALEIGCQFPASNWVIERYPAERVVEAACYAAIHAYKKPKRALMFTVLKNGSEVPRDVIGQAFDRLAAVGAGVPQWDAYRSHKAAGENHADAWQKVVGKEQRAESGEPKREHA